MIDIISIIVLITSLIALEHIFKKAGEAGWQAFVPILNIYVLFKILKISMIFLVISFLSCFFIISLAISGPDSSMDPKMVVIILLCAIVLVLAFFTLIFSKLSVAFGKSWLFALGLFFLTPIFLCILGFGSSIYMEENVE